jgi:lipid II:glycine glycyltransferase (peptidoglycan interpeptide bridge formation enzyme)
LVERGKFIDGFTLTIHKIPKTPYTIGYLPKGRTPRKEVLSELQRIGIENNCIFIQLEPNLIGTLKNKPRNLKQSFHPLFTKFTFVLDLSKSEEELLKSFHPKTRYNIRVAQKHNVKIKIQNSEEAFKEYLRLTKETTERQKFFAHTPVYHTKMWETLGNTTDDKKHNSLKACLLTASYKPDGEKEQTLAAWILFVFHDYLYYPYGSSSTLHRNVMASNLIMWEAIKFGKQLGLHYFDMWGALGNPPNAKDPWYGFHKFKEGYGASHTEFSGSYDLVIRPTLYELYKIADRARQGYLKLIKTF